MFEVAVNLVNQLTTEKGGAPDDDKENDWRSIDTSGNDHKNHGHAEYPETCGCCREEEIQEMHERAEADYDFEDLPL